MGNLLFFIIGLAVLVFACVVGFIWVNGVVLYYKDDNYRARYGKPMFWPFIYKEDR